MTGAERGAALLVVIGALSALAVPAALLLFAAVIAYESEGNARETAQARLLVEAARRQVEYAIENGALEPPSGGAPLTLTNGVDPSGRDTGLGRFPVPPEAPLWPPLTDQPAGGPAPFFGVGSEMILAVVVGPRGDVRGPRGAAAADLSAGVLLDLSVRVWFRRAVAGRRWRYVWAGSSLRRLD